MREDLERRGAAAPDRAPDEAAVVLVHGYFCPSRALYWDGLRPLRRELRAAGHPVYRSCQPRTGPVEARARRLARCLDALPHPRLILVGHSMGGLDARFVASRLDPSRRVSHVVTVGTPHRGTALAEWALRDSVWLTRLARFFDRGALIDLTRERARRLDALMPDRPDVGYLALAGDCPSRRLAGLLRRLAERLGEEEGPNDGLVSLRSALRGPGARALSASHLELIGQRLFHAEAGPAPASETQPVAVLRSVLLRLLAGGSGASLRPS